MIWLEVCQLDGVIQTTNQFILELNIIQTHWWSLNAEQRTGAAFFQLAIAAEEVLWSFYSQPSTAMRQVAAKLNHPPHDLLAQVMGKPVPVEIDQALQRKYRPDPVALPAKPTDSTTEPLTEPTEAAAPSEEPEKRPQRGAPHAFVVMTFGRKQDRDGCWINFDSIYGDLIKPALTEAGFEPFRADQETVRGDILTDMF